MANLFLIPQIISLDDFVADQLSIQLMSPTHVCYLHSTLRIWQKFIEVSPRKAPKAQFLILIPNYNLFQNLALSPKYP